MKIKKLFIFMLALAVTLVGLLMINNQIFGLKPMLRRNFEIDLNNVHLQKIKQIEEWAPNGDGEKLIVLKYNNLKNVDIDKLKKLPVKDELPPNNIPLEYLDTQNGYYIHVVDKADRRNFDILIINTVKKEIYVYFQIM